MTLNLDRGTWKRVKFGDVIESVTDRVDDPSKAGVDRYVGLEHLDPGSMTVTRWGTPDQVEAQKLRFQPGDVIFGRRRAYQKKVARADFEGICSAHALVLRAKTAMIDPDFLPVFLSSAVFLDRAIKISVGSLSPTVNWKTLAIQEFDLPPLDEQKRIAALLWALAAHKGDLRTALSSLDVAISAFCRAAVEWSLAAGEIVLMTEAAEISMGRQKAPKYMTGERSHPFISVANVGHLELDLTKLQEMDFSPTEVAKFSLRPGDVVVTEGDLVSPLNVGRPALCGDAAQGLCFQNTLIRFRPKAGVDSRYALAVLEGMRLAGTFAAAASTTTVTHLGLRRFSSLTFPVVSEVEQRSVAEELDALFAARTNLRTEVQLLCDLEAAFASEELT